MEHWQFLIQKQGDRSWHTLESPNIQILEGRYRVLARSNLPNTDVEVRVTHSSTQEVPPKRRIQKQSRRTNSEGLMAVIPFTLLKPGMWELRCSGDLMSDIFGKSWQHSVYLQVLSQFADGAVEKLIDGGDVESNSLDFFMIPLPSSQNFYEHNSSVGNNLISTGLESSTHSNLVTSELSAEIASIASDGTTITTAEEITETESVVHELPVEETVVTSDRTLSVPTEEMAEIESVVHELPVEETVVTSDRTLSVPTEEITEIESVVHELPVEETVVTSDRTLSVPTEEMAEIESVVHELPVEETVVTSDHTLSVPTEEITETESVVHEPPVNETLITTDGSFSVNPEEITESGLVVCQQSFEKEEDAIINQPVSPVWLKGETAEQILQNLIDQALPTSLLEDEELEETPTIQPAPPLQLTLEQENYIARWGQGLNINANVELQEKLHHEDEPQYSTTFHTLEVKIELRSPLSSDVLAQVQQPLADNSLPFTINSAINIPVDCESKLLLGELSLYGAISDFGKIILLASRSFTVTADVTELLAMTAVVKSNQPNLLENSISLGLSLPNQEPETSVSLGLELFNLVKTPLAQPQTILPSPNQPLPPQINLLSLKKSGDWRSPQLPNLPENQISAIANNDAVAEVPPEGKEEIEQQDNASPAPTTIPLAPINLEQLAIKHRPGWMLGNRLPYLKRLKNLPADQTEVTTNVPELAEVSDTVIVEDSVQVEPPIAAYENPDAENSVVETLASPNNLDTEDSVLETPVSPNKLDTEDSVIKALVSPNSELLAEPMPEMAVTPSLEFSDDSILEPATPLSSELIAEVNPYSSPLIRKWMQSQGYVVPELPPIAKQHRETEVLEPVSVDEELIEPDDLPIPSVDADLSSNLDAELENLHIESEVNEVNIELQSSSNVSEITEDTEISIITEASEELNISTELEIENIPQELSTYSLPLTQLPLTQKIKIPRAWLAQEIVVDDTYSEQEEDVSSEQKQQSISAVPNSLPLDGQTLDPLPIPQLHIPEGELIAGQSVRVRVELPQVPSQVVVKLWIEDCQTRGLLDGPHLLKDLLPKASGGVEVMTQINVPFGCVEIRVEAIAFNISTQQESHKATAVRTVIPPDLPNYQLDELLGL